MPHRFLVGVTSCSGRTVIHTHPVPLRIEDLFAIFGSVRLTSDTSPSNGRPRRLANHSKRRTLRWWLNIPSGPAPSITNTTCNTLVRLYQRMNYSKSTQTSACPTFYLVICTGLKCSKYSVQILQSVISGLTSVTPISQTCMNIRVKKV